MPWSAYTVCLVCKPEQKKSPPGATSIFFSLLVKRPDKEENSFWVLFYLGLFTFKMLGQWGVLFGPLPTYFENKNIYGPPPPPTHTTHTHTHLEISSGAVRVWLIFFDFTYSI